MDAKTIQALLDAGNLLTLNPQTGVYESYVPVSATAATVLSKMADDGYITLTEVGDDRGMIINYQMSVLDELVVGGDSYPVPIAFHVDYADIVGNVVSNAVDITEILQSDDGSTTGLFGGTTVGKCLLIGSHDRYGGVKTKIATKGLMLNTDIQAEFLSNATPLWLRVPHMAAGADFPYPRYGTNLCNVDASSEQWRFGFDPEFLPSPWDEVELTIDGIPHTHRWSLIRITNPITTDPIIEQIKPHPNGWECNKNGVHEFFGIARYRKTLTEGLKNAVNNAAGSPTNETVLYTPDIAASFIDNEFKDGFKNGFLIPQTIVEGLDTSIPLLLNVSYYVKGVDVGTIELSTEMLAVDDEFLYDGLVKPVIETKVLSVVVVNSNLKRITTQIKIPIDNVLKGGAMIHLYRDAQVGNAADTLAANIVITNIILDGFFWK